jgi:hypothetical protein
MRSHIYIYVCVCVCVCVLLSSRPLVFILDVRTSEYPTCHVCDRYLAEFHVKNIKCYKVHLVGHSSQYGTASIND